MRLSGKVAVVTGSTRGIGRGIAEEFAAQGARVAVVGRNAARGADVVTGIEAAGGEAHFFAVDLADEPATVGLVSAVTGRWGRLDILVNNAAPTDDLAAKVDGPLSELTTERWRRLLTVGLDSAVWLTGAALRWMKGNGGGAIINITSLAAARGHSGVDAYTAAKGALASLTRSVAVEYASFGVRCNAIVVGLVPVSEDPRSVTNDPANAAMLQAFQVAGRVGTPRDIALGAVYLASGEADFVTGTELVIDGGASIKLALPPVATVT
jgi:NAD(P)-dependent dehydrogenase (short-subunit alcohol dehydrogenase family)